MKIKILLLFLIMKISGISQKLDTTYTFYFASNSSNLTTVEISKFQSFWKQFENCKNCILTLEGYTDQDGSDSFNYLLAQNRIDFVKTLLINIDQFQVNSVAFGEEQFGLITIDKKLNRKVNLQLKCQKNEIKEVKKDTLSKESIKEVKVETKVEKQTNRFEEFKVRGKAITLNILFYPGISAFLPESTDDLELLYAYLIENLTVNANIIGHVCCSPEYKLSQNRAYVVYDYLVSKGIDKKRLSHEGRSNREPKVKEINEATEKINRRVEIVFFE